MMEVERFRVPKPLHYTCGDSRDGSQVATGLAELIEQFISRGRRYLNAVEALATAHRAHKRNVDEGRPGLAKEIIETSIGPLSNGLEGTIWRLKATGEALQSVITNEGLVGCDGQKYVTRVLYRLSNFAHDEVASIWEECEVALNAIPTPQSSPEDGEVTLAELVQVFPGLNVGTISNRKSARKDSNPAPLACGARGRADTYKYLDIRRWLISEFPDKASELPDSFGKFLSRKSVPA